MDDFFVHKRPSRWLWIAAVWLGVGLIDASQTVFPMQALGMHHAWVKLFVTVVASWLPWALVTPLVIRLGRRYPPFRNAPVRALFIHMGAAAGIGLIYSAWNTALERLLDPWAEPQPPGTFLSVWLLRFSYIFLTSMIVYGFIVAITFVVDSKERLARQQTEAARLNEQLANAQLAALRRQMEPHFMFNTLNAISGLVRDHRNDAAVHMIVGLSDFLRRAVENSNRPRVALAEEVEYLQRYLDIQQVRFAERLRVTVDIPAELLEVPVPNLILQPLLENAIKHGIAKRVEGGSIRVEGSRSHGRLTLKVHNEGPPLSPDWEAQQTGTGISNLRSRLQILYGPRFEFMLRNSAAGGVEVLISLPLEEA
jgi:two-component system, LytTR family, sensor kinase